MVNHFNLNFTIVYLGYSGLQEVIAEMYSQQRAIMIYWYVRERLSWSDPFSHIQSCCCSPQRRTLTTREVAGLPHSRRGGTEQVGARAAAAEVPAAEGVPSRQQPPVRGGAALRPRPLRRQLQLPGEPRRPQPPAGGCGPQGRRRRRALRPTPAGEWAEKNFAPRRASRLCG